MCDQVDQVAPGHQVDDIDEVHELDPLHQVDHKDERCDDIGRFGVAVCCFCGLTLAEPSCWLDLFARVPQ